MFAVLAFIVFVIIAVRDWAATAPDHQLGLLAAGLALVALHFVWGWEPVVRARGRSAAPPQ